MSIPGLRSLYAWILRQAEKPYATHLLFLIAVVEAWTLIPADTLLVPMAIARRDKALRLAAIASAGLTVGTIALVSAGHLFIKHHPSLPSIFQHVQHGFYAFMACATLLRCGRFFVEGWLIYKFGDPVRHFIEKHLPTIFIGALIAIAIGFWLVVKQWV